MTEHIFLQNELHSKYSCSIPWNREECIYHSCNYFSCFPMIMYFMIYYEYQSEDKIHLFRSLILSATFIMTTITLHIWQEKVPKLLKIVNTNYKEQASVFKLSSSSGFRAAKWWSTISCVTSSSVGGFHLGLWSLSINRARTPGNNRLINKEFLAGLWAYFPAAWISSSTYLLVLRQNPGICRGSIMDKSHKQW